jgi:hypothetical protein
LKTFEIFICHKKSSGKDFAEHLKAGLEELGYHSFLDSKDIPKTTDGKEEWVSIRDQALKESNTFILIITPGFDLSQEVKNELELARSLGNKQFIYFRHRDLGRKIIIDLESEKVDLGRQEQVSFENKEELLRLAHGILLKSSVLRAVCKPKTPKPVRPQSAKTGKPIEKTEISCEMCAKKIEGQPFTELIGDKRHIFDCKECAQTFKKFRCVYGESFQV